MELIRGLNNKERFGTLPDDVKLYTLFKNGVDPACFTPDELCSLGEAMAKVRMSGSSALAGYTYLGQFLAHDLSRLRIEGHDKTVKSFDTDILRSNVSAVLDLGSVYGGATANSPMRVENSACMRVGAAQRPDGSLLCGYDLPRDEENGIACIGDDRNDENLIVAQLHVQFLRLHNFFVDTIKAEQPFLDTEALFLAARQQVVLHYHEVILYDFLYEILHPAVWKAIILNDRNILWNPTTNDPAVLPIEYAAAAGRFGHSMVQPRYFLNSLYSVGLDALFTMTGPGGFGDDHIRLPTSHAVDWLRFFNFPSVERVARPGKNKAQRISPKVDIVLVNIESMPKPEYVSLAERNLLRGFQIGLCSGQAAVNYMLNNFHQQLDEYKIPVRLLTPDELNLSTTDYSRGVMDQCPTLRDKTPLWFYLLAEACVEVYDDIGKLGPLGSLIVAETVKGLLKLDRTSVFNVPKRREDIRPTKTITGVPGRHLQMSDLILAATPGLPNPTKL